MHNVNTLRHSPVKDIFRNTLAPGLMALALMGGSGLPVQAEQQPAPPAAAEVNNETVVSSEESPILNMHDDYYIMEEDTVDVFRPFENDQLDWSQIGHWILTISPGPSVHFPWQHDVLLMNNRTERVLMMEFHGPPIGQHTFTIQLQQKNGTLSDESTIFLDVIPQKEKLTMYLPMVGTAGIASGSGVANE